MVETAHSQQKILELIARFEHNDGQPTVLETYELMRKLYKDPRDPASEELDSSKKPKFLHMLRMMANLPHADDPQLRKDRAICILMHDGVEDRKITIDRLKRLGYSEANIMRIYALNRQPAYSPEVEKPNGDREKLFQKHREYQQHLRDMIGVMPDYVLDVYIIDKFLDHKDNKSAARLKDRLNPFSEERQAARHDKYGPEITKDIYDICKQFVDFKDWGHAMQHYIREQGLEPPRDRSSLAPTTTMRDSIPLPKGEARKPRKMQFREKIQKNSLNLTADVIRD